MAAVATATAALGRSADARVGALSPPGVVLGNPLRTRSLRWWSTTAQLAGRAWRISHAPSSNALRTLVRLISVPTYDVASNVRQALLVGGGVHRARRAGWEGWEGCVASVSRFLPRTWQVYSVVKNPRSSTDLGAASGGRGVASARPYDGGGGGGGGGSRAARGNLCGRSPLPRGF